MKKIALSLLVALGLSAPIATLANEPAVQTQQAEKAQGIWIDVRTPEEFNEGHIEGAINIPHEQIAERIKEVTANKDAQINLYCKSGRRAGIALESLKGLGYTNVTNQGGYKDLVAKGIK